MPNAMQATLYEFRGSDIFQKNTLYFTKVNKDFFLLEGSIDDTFRFCVFLDALYVNNVK